MCSKLKKKITTDHLQAPHVAVTFCLEKTLIHLHQKPSYQYWLLYMYYAHADIGVNKRPCHCLVSKKHFPKMSGNEKYSFVNVHSSKAHQIVFHRILLIMVGETMTLLVLLNHSSWHPSAQTMMASATGSCNIATAK